VLGLDVVPHALRRADDIVPAFDTHKCGHWRPLLG
jgi:hypothetical protein